MSMAPQDIIRNALSSNQALINQVNQQAASYQAADPFNQLETNMEDPTIAMEDPTQQIENPGMLSDSSPSNTNNSTAADLIQRALASNQAVINNRAQQLMTQQPQPVTSFPGPSAPISAPTGSAPIPANVSGDLASFMRAESGQESGNPNSTNPDSGAHGIYQIMPSNWASWARDAGLPSNAPQTAANQQQVAAHKFQQYYGDLHSWPAVAVAWYSGEGNAEKWLKNPNAPIFNARQGGGKYPSINDYVRGVMAKMGIKTG